MSDQDAVSPAAPTESAADAETARAAAVGPGVPVGPAVPIATGPTATGPTATAQPQTGPIATGPLPEWMLPPEPIATHHGLAGWALAFSIAGLFVSLFVGWGFPVALVGIVTAAFALRRPAESRLISGWALALGIVAVLYSLGWLAWAATRSNLFG